MALSVFNNNQSPQPNQDYVTNYYHVKKYSDDKFLITVNHGGWAVLNKDEFDLLRFNNINENKELRTMLENKGIILTKNNRDMILNSTKNKYHHTQRGTSLHIMVPTLRCNHKCIYCHAKSVDPSKKGYDMTLETAKKVVDFMFQTPSRVITIEFQGGEPTLNFEVIKFVETYSRELNKTHNKELNLVIVTNFTNIGEKEIQYFLDKKISLCSSLDGPKELHNKNRVYVGGAENTYDTVIETIKLCRSMGGELGVLPTITKESLKYPKEIVDEYVKHGFNHIMSRNLNVMGFAKQIWKQIGYTAEEYLDFFKTQLDYIIKLNKEGIPFTDIKSKFILQRMLSPDARSFTCLGSPCGAVVGQIAYDQDGNIFTCDEGRSEDLFKIGNVHKDNYKDIIQNSACKIVDFTSSLSSLCDNCIWHPYCGTCMVGVYGGQGNIVSKLAFDHECKIRYGQHDYLMNKLINDKDARALFQHWAFPNKNPFPFKEAKEITDKQKREQEIVESISKRKVR